MKKILSLFLVALSALGLTATVYANENDYRIMLNESYIADLSVDTVRLEYYDMGGDFGLRTYINEVLKSEDYEVYIGGPEGDEQPFHFDIAVMRDGIKQGVLKASDYTYMLSVGPIDQYEDKGFRIGSFTFQGLNTSVTLEIERDLRPAISGQETFATKVDEARPVEYFVGFLKAIDDIDGDISDDIYIVTDNYTPNKSVLGTHEVTVGVEDSSGNVSEFTFKVAVVDITAPLINGNSSVVSIGYKETYNIANFKSTLTVSDNYDTLSASDITIKSDNYTTNKTKLGTWNVVFEVTDSSGNTATFTKPIKVIDNVAPVFSGIETLTKSYTEVMTLSDIIAQVTANDEIDGNLTNKITVANDGFTGKSNKVGTHYIELSVTDNAGNTSTRTLTIKVIDDQSAGWFITNGVSINLTPGTELTRTQIVELLNKSGQVLAPANARITYLTDTYSDNIGTPGTYTLAFRTVLTNGQENNYTYAVNVLDDKTEEDTEVLPGLPFYEKNKIAVWSITGVALLAIAYYLFKPKKKKR